MKIRQLLSQTAIYGLGIMLNRSVSFILIPLYTNHFTPSELGIFTLVQSLSIFLGFIYVFGLETAFMKKFIDAANHKEKSDIYSSSILFLLVTSAALSAVLYSFAGQISDMLGISDSETGTGLLRLMSVVMVFDTLYRFPMLLFRAELKSVTYSLMNLVSFLINVGLNLYLIRTLGMGPEAIFYSYLASVTAILVITLVINRKYFVPSVNIRCVKDLLAYGFKFIFIGVFLLVIDMSDRFFLQKFHGETSVGIYWANYRLASVMGLIIAAFRFTWTPFFLNLNEAEADKPVIAKVAGYYVSAGLALFLLFGLFADLLASAELFGFRFLGDAYLSGLPVVPLLLLAYFFSGLYSTFNAAPFFTDKTSSLFCITLGAVVLNLALNYFLIPEFDVKGAAAATLITYFCMAAVTVMYSQKIFRVEINFSGLAGLFAAALILFAAGYYGVNESGLSLPVKIAADSAIFFVFCLILARAGFLPAAGLRGLFAPGKSQ